jgi:predicted naringenin-chalcone synthase
MEINLFMSQIISIGTAVPQHSYSQSDLVNKMLEFHGWDDPVQHRKLRVLYKRTAIETRHSVIPDFSMNGALPRLFEKTAGATDMPSVESRLSVFRKEAFPLAHTAIKNNFIQNGMSVQDVTHLITVSCTGMAAPGLELKIIEELGLPPDIRRFGVNFMGCYAVFHALQMADALCKADESARVLIVSVELCTLHFQSRDESDILLANALFSDGAASALVVSDQIAADQTDKPALNIRGFGSYVLQKGKQDMGWDISSDGFIMTLSSAIPDLIQENITRVAGNVLDNYNLTTADIAHWAIHPGGRKILTAIESALNLPASALDVSRKILADFGNMSSATILFVLKEMLENGHELHPGETIFSAGFGPGLALESALFTYE